MNYEQTIDYLYSLLPVFHRIGAKAFKPDLSNTIKLCEHLGNPHRKFKSIHIGGTNGKGSTSHYMASIFQCAGYKTGLYTSPHLKDYTERFRINGKSIEKANIVSFVEQNIKIIEQLKPSFFELSVVLAFDFFAKEKVDIAIIEVGLGGRLDSTNIITPELSIITNIGLDHTDILGDTLQKIATEKAGIIKPNVPVVISEKNIATSAVFINKAHQEKTTIYFASENFRVTLNENTNLKLSVNVLNKDNKILFANIESELIGQYQLKNLAGVFQSIYLLNQLGFNISTSAIRKGIAEVVTLTGLKGRWQIISQNPLVICDTGHNEHGIREVLNHLSKFYFNKKYFILGFVQDKNVEEILELFPKDAKYFFCQANSPRSMSPENLLKIAHSKGLSGYSILSVNDALKKAKKKC